MPFISGRRPDPESQEHRAGWKRTDLQLIQWVERAGAASRITVKRVVTRCDDVDLAGRGLDQRGPEPFRYIITHRQGDVRVAEDQDRLASAMLKARLPVIERLGCTWPPA